MGDSPMHNRYSRSPSPRRRYSSSRSPVRRDNGTSLDAVNPGNNLYVAGLSVRVKEKDLEDLFSQEGKVIECRLVVDPRTRESRGFGFVTMETLEDAERCIKYLNRSTFEGRIITVEKSHCGRDQLLESFQASTKFINSQQMVLFPRLPANISSQAKRKRARTPTPGEYLGMRATNRRLRGYRREYDRDVYSSQRSPKYSPYRNGRDRRERSPRYSPYRGATGYRREHSPSYSPYRDGPDRRERSPRYSPYRGAPGCKREHSLSPSPEYSPHQR